MACEHKEIVVMYHYSSDRVDLMFQCVECLALINKFDNTKTYKIIPNGKMENPPVSDGLWTNKRES